MTGSVYRSDPADARRLVELDGVSLIYHHRSGLTHIVAPPAPQILEILDRGEADIESLLASLCNEFEIENDADSRTALKARLDELEIAGLVWRI